MATIHPDIAANIPSKRNGNWIENDEAPTSFITPVSRRRLNAAIRRVLLINNAAVKTEAKPIAKAPFLNTPNNLKNLSSIALWSCTISTPGRPLNALSITENLVGSFNLTLKDSGN